MEIVIGVATKIAEYTVGPIVRPIARHIVRPMTRPFINLWEYESNLENLSNEGDKLKAEGVRVQGLTPYGVEPLPDIKLWQDKVTNITNEVSVLTSEDNPEQKSMKCCKGCTYSNLKECYQRRNNVARKLKDVAQLLQEAKKSTISWEYKSNLEKLKKEVEKLKAKRDSVKCSIKVGEEPLPDVKFWQDNVNNIINEVSGLTSEHNPEQQNNVTRMLKEVAQLLQEAAQFTKVSYQPIPKQTCFHSIQQESSESRMSMLKDITAALRNADVNMVGIYGMGGVGKTTLAKKVETQAMQDKLFDKIVFVEVSQSPDIRTIQGVIADYLGLKFQEETVAGRAIKLCDVLKKEKKILIILDNLWKGIKLEEVGIPFGKDCKGLKLLLTARSRDVLTKGMDSQHNFHVEALSEADAWILFKSIAGMCTDHPHLKSVAQEVAKKCGGMPVAIVTIAKALKDTQSEDEWKEALRRLNNPSSESFEGITKEVYNSIKLSYDCLDGKLKEIFLLCSLMGCTYDASVEDLFRYGLGLGFFDEFDKVEDALCNVYASVNQLKAASLLLDAHASHRFFRPILVRERFAIHDVICAVARSIASEDRHALFVPQSLTNENKLKNCTSISLYNIGELLKDLKLVCPQLKFLYVNPMLLYPKTHSRISDKFFAWMPRLQVLHLIQMDLCSTPLSDLVNLQTLCLEYCVLKDIADIGDLKNLEILSFRNCTGFRLPEKLPKLTKVRLFELKCYELNSIPSEFILSFKKLEALYMSYTIIKWEVEKSNNGSRNASRDVVEHLSNLTSLEISIPDATMLRGLLSPKLERYNITIGSLSLPALRFDWDIRCKTSRFLRVKLITKEDGIISRLKPIRQLVLDEVPGIANNFCGLDRMGFPELEDLKVQNNSHILHIVDAVSDDGVFPVLKSLILWNLINLKTICNGSLGMKLFHQLRTIKVGKCHELTNLFSFASDRVFQELEEIEVDHCEKMKEIFAISEQVPEIKFSKLRILRLTSLPQLESLCCNVKTTTPILQFTSDIKPEEIILEEERDVSKPLFNEKVVVTNLETLEINNINVRSIWDNQLPTTVNIPNLTCLIISNLANLKRLGSGDYIKFPLLKEMTIRSCPKFKEFFFDDKVGVPRSEKLNIFKMYNLKMIWHNQLVQDSFPKLKSLQVQECHNLRRLGFGDYIKFPLLNKMTIKSCPKFNEYFFDDKVGVPSVEKINISKMDNLKLIWHNQLVEDSFPKLKSLRVQECHNLRRLSSGDYIKFPLLKKMTIKSCPKFEEYFFDDKVGVPSVEKINISKMDNLKLIWHNQLVEDYFPKLKSLRVQECHNLRRLSSEDYIKFPLLKEMMIGSCPKFEEYFFYDKVGVPSLEKVNMFKMENLKMIWHNQLVEDSFPKLNSLQVRECHNLRRLGSGDYIKFPLLKEMTIESCPKFKEYLFDDKVGVPSLEKVNIFKMENLKMIWHNQLVQDSFPKLKSLQIQECRKLLTLFQSNMCGRFLSLETLNVSKCGSLEETLDLRGISYRESYSTTSTQNRELCTCSPLVLSFANLQNLKVSKCQSLKTIVAKEEVEAKKAPQTARFVFPKLTSLELYELPELRTFYPGRYIMEWPILKTLKMHQYDIHDTNMMRVKQQLPLLPNEVGFEFQVGEIWPNLLLTMSSWVQNLSVLILHGCDNLEELFPYSMVVTEELSGKKTSNTIVFPKLNYLEMKQLANLKGLCSRCQIEFPTLKEFKISNCSELTAFIFDDKVKVPSLTKLKISSMDNLKMIWDNQLAESFIPKFKSLQVQGCQKLLTFFRSNVYGRFLSLETLDVSDCGSLEEIFDLHEINSEERHSTTSTQSKELYTTVLSFANLQYLKVSECRSLKSLFSIANVSKESVVVKEAHAIAKFVFPKLTSLKMDKLPKLRTFYPSRYTVEWPNLRRLQLWDYGIPHIDNEDQVQHLLFLVKKAAPCLEELLLSGRELMMMWQGQDPEPLFRNFKILEVLDESKAGVLLYEGQPVLHYIGEVKYMWKQNFKLDLILPNFEKIVVGRCDSFISLMPPSASLRNLTSLEVYDCNSLEHIGTLSMGKNLVRLVSLRIYRCEKIVEVLRNHEDLTGDKIVFSNLKRLSLVDLPSLTSFCSWNFTLEFPSLEELKVNGCPDMKIFSQGELTTPKLHEVKAVWRSIKLCPDVDVSTAIQQLHEQEQGDKFFVEDLSDLSTDESE